MGAYAGKRRHGGQARLIRISAHILPNQEDLSVHVLVILDEIFSSPVAGCAGFIIPSIRVVFLFNSSCCALPIPISW